MGQPGQWQLVNTANLYYLVKEPSLQRCFYFIKKIIKKHVFPTYKQREFTGGAEKEMVGVFRIAMATKRTACNPRFFGSNRTLSVVFCLELFDLLMDDSEDQNWSIDCSDDELKNCSDPWEPNPEEIDLMYSLLNKGELPELKWKCPGYRTPSPERREAPQEENELKKYVQAKLQVLLQPNLCQAWFVKKTCLLDRMSKMILISWMKWRRPNWKYDTKEQKH